MGRVIRTQRRGRGSIFKARTHRRIAPSQLRPLDFVEKVYRLRGTVEKLMHEPGRGAPIAVIRYRDPVRFGIKRSTIVAAEGLYTGQYVYSGVKAKLQVGNILPVGKVPEGIPVCSLEEATGDRSKFARASGTYAIVIAHSKDGKRTRVKLPSGQRKNVPSTCRCMVGIVAGGGRVDKPLMKAGNAFNKFRSKRKKWPVVRGVAMNPVEHPFGGGNHQHIGHPSTVSRNAPPGAKVGQIAARRSGLLRGGRKVIKGD
eukprot:GHVH01006535.1.p1 GENE.GHVH01006535.1~~GHVH01006535.1.p1  ORF type:complete len:257 (+),score=28.16 GHVH01006535.1:78-848(+)